MLCKYKCSFYVFQVDKYWWKSRISSCKINLFRFTSAGSVQRVKLSSESARCKCMCLSEQLCSFAFYWVNNLINFSYVLFGCNVCPLGMLNELMYMCLIYSFACKLNTLK